MNKNHIIRATLESIAYQVSDVLEAMNADSGIALTSLKVDGGASANNVLMQLQADILQCAVNRPVCVETTALAPPIWRAWPWATGPARRTCCATGRVDRAFTPAISPPERDEKLRGWKRAVSRSFDWAKEE